MTTDKQRKANRENAKKSTGPRTAEGKARSSQNGLKHGLLARDAVMADEDPADYDRLLQEFEHYLFPKNVLEFVLVRQIADAEWRLRRLDRLQAGFSTHAYTGVTRRTKKWDPDTILPGRDGENQMLGKSMDERTPQLTNLGRCETMIHRTMKRAVNMLRQLRLDEAKFGGNVEPKTGAIHRATVTGFDYYADDPQPPLQRYEPPAAVAETTRGPIGFRPPPSAATPLSASAQATSSAPPTAGVARASWRAGSASPPTSPAHNPLATTPCPQCRGTACRARRPDQPQNVALSIGLESRITNPETRLTNKKPPQTHSRRTYLKSMVWTPHEALGPRHETRPTPATHLPGGAAAEVMAR